MNTDKLLEIAQRIAAIASSVERKTFYFLLLAGLATSSIAWHWLDFSNLSFFFFVKAFLLLSPLALWLMLWVLLKQLTELPENLSELKTASQEGLAMVHDLQSGTTEKKNLFRNILSLVNLAREPEIIENIALCVKGIGLLINPFAVFALILAAILMIIFIFVGIGFAVF